MNFKNNFLYEFLNAKIVLPEHLRFKVSVYLVTTLVICVAISFAGLFVNFHAFYAMSFFTMSIIFMPIVLHFYYLAKSILTRAEKSEKSKFNLASFAKLMVKALILIAVYVTIVVELIIALCGFMVEQQ